jgi:predicted actin-binding protein
MRKQFIAAALIAALAALTAVATAKAAAPGNTTAPAVTGTPKVGQTLTVSNGTWTNSPTSYAYQWQRCTSATSCTDIAGATKQTYTAVDADAGRVLRAVVTATNADGSATANSNQTATVAAGGGPTNTLKPAILGDAFVGQRLTATNGRWSGAPTSFSYQWQRCNSAGGECFNIAGATGKTYGVSFADVYSTIGVAVTAKNADGSRTAHSDTTDLVQPFEPVVTPGNKAPTLKFISLRRVGVRVYARFSVCDDAAKSVTVIERDAKAGALAYTRKFAVTPNSCITATRSWTPAPRFRTKGRFVVTLRAVDKSGASSRFATRSLTNR